MIQISKDWKYFIENKLCFITKISKETIFPKDWKRNYLITDLQVKKWFNFIKNYVNFLV